MNSLVNQIIAAGRAAGRSDSEIARMLATAQSESGMNPRSYGDANDGGAYGPFQFNYGKGRLGQTSGIAPGDIDGQINYVARHWPQIGNSAIFHGMNNRVYGPALARYSAMMNGGPEYSPPAAHSAPHAASTSSHGVPTPPVRPDGLTAHIPLVNVTQPPAGEMSDGQPPPLPSTPAPAEPMPDTGGLLARFAPQQSAPAPMEMKDQLGLLAQAMAPQPIAPIQIGKMKPQRSFA